MKWDRQKTLKRLQRQAYGIHALFCLASCHLISRIKKHLQYNIASAEYVFYISYHYHITTGKSKNLSSFCPFQRIYNPKALANLAKALLYWL